MSVASSFLLYSTDGDMKRLTPPSHVELSARRQKLPVSAFIPAAILILSSLPLGLVRHRAGAFSREGEGTPPTG
jgi:hypothetical protein